MTHIAETLRRAAQMIEDDYGYHQDERDSIYMESRLRSQFPKFGDGVNRRPLDKTYYCCWKTDLEHFIKHEWGDARQYVKQKYDCEQFAFRFKALADQHGFNNVGIVDDFGGDHMYNIVVFPGPQDPVLIEPQQDRFLQPEPGTLHDFQKARVML